MIYKNKDKISFPLGGIGSGCVGIAGNGAFIDWEIFNRPNKNSVNGFTNFAVRAFRDEKIVDSRILVGDTDSGYDGIPFGVFGEGADRMSFQGFPHFKDNDFDGEYPFATLDFNDVNFPGTVKLTAFNPYIPLDSKNSSIPAAFYDIEFYNPTNKELKYQAILSVQNPFENSKNVIKDSSIIMYNEKASENNLCIATDCQCHSECNYWYRGWQGSFFKDNIRTFWNELSSGDIPKVRNYKSGSFDMCSLMSSVNIMPFERKSVRFVLSWYIPYGQHYWYPQNGAGWKNYYATVFNDSYESAIYSLKNWKYLYEKTVVFKNELYSSTMPESFKSAVSSALSVIKSPTVLRLENGSLYGWEGSAEKSGSCEGLCQHVWSYAYVLCYLFPDLERGIRDNELKYGVSETGETVFRLPLPFDSDYYVNLFENNGKKFRPCADGQMGEIIKIFREWKFSGDTNWLRSNWEKIKKIIRFAYSKENDCRWDSTKSGIIDGRQHHTFDIELFGASAWIEGFYLAALKSGSIMAHALSDTEAEKEFSLLFQNGYKFTKEKLFNGEYFIQDVDVTDKNILSLYDCDEIFWNEETHQINHQIANGCLIDQLCGQWHADLCGLGNIFDISQVKKALISIYKNNFKKTFRDFANPWRLFAINDESGTIICDYPNNVDKPKNPIPYCEEVMSGFEYAFAGLLVSNGYVEEADNVVSAVRNRYDGKKRNPFNDIECGNNYARSMSAFALLPLLSGFTADLTQNKVTFYPKIKSNYFKCIWSVSTGWGIFELKNNKLIISVKQGYIYLERICLPFAQNVISSSIDKFDFSNDEVCFEKICLRDTVSLKIQVKEDCL